MLISVISEWEKPEIKLKTPEVKPKIIRETKAKRISLTQNIFKDDNAWKEHRSISGYIHGIKNGVQVVKFFLKYDDKRAKLNMEENISKGLHTEFIVISDRIEEIKKNLAPITAKENSTPAVDANKRNRIDKIIRKGAANIYKNHSDVFGLRISNIRNVGGEFIEEPCIVIYCLDKSFIPANENKLPTELDGWPCDIRENIIMFGGRTNLESSIGTPYDGNYGSIGFLAKSNVSADPQMRFSGFLTAAHVAIKQLDKLHKENALLTECKSREGCEFAKERHIIVRPPWYCSPSCKPIGEVVESYCGNYKPPEDNNSFGIDAAFINTYLPKYEGKCFKLFLFTRE